MPYRSRSLVPQRQLDCTPTKLLKAAPFLIFSLLIGTSLAGCAIPLDPVPSLAGTIVRGHDLAPLTESEMGVVSAEADVVYLGEIHDNPWHHEIQLAVIQRLVERGARPVIGFEFFDAGQTGVLMGYVNAGNDEENTRDSSRAEKNLRQRLGWGRERDAEWGAYYPLLEYARQQGLAVFGTDLPAGIRRRITQNGVPGLTPVERRFVVDTGFNDGAYRRLMEREFIKSHCGWSDPRLLDHLYQNWIARNDAMATAISEMLSDEQNRPVVMIVGAGHSRYNMGIYERVAALVAGVRQVNIGLIPVKGADTSLAEYLHAEKVNGRVFVPVYDYLWFTQAKSRIDPCIKFKERLAQPPEVRPSE